MAGESTSGKLFTATIGTGPVITITGLLTGELKDVGDVLDSTDSDSAPYYNTDVGCVGKEGTLTGHFRPNGMQYPILKMGALLTNLRIYPHGQGNPPFVFPQAICLAGTVSVELKGKVQFTIPFASKGIFYNPGEGS